MKVIKLFLFALSVSFLATGCTGYIDNRFADLMDIPNISLGNGAGLKARVGPFQAGVAKTDEQFGWLYSEWISGYVPGEEDGDPINTDFTVLAWSHEVNKAGAYRGKDFDAETGAWFFGGPKDGEGKLFYLTEVEIYGGALVTGRLGANWGEAIDFILGLFCIDIMKDDLMEDEAEKGDPVPPKPKRHPKPEPYQPLKDRGHHHPGGTAPDGASGDGGSGKKIKGHHHPGGG